MLCSRRNNLVFLNVIPRLIESAIPGDDLSLSAIRTIRVLRPLRAINRVPSMRILVMLLLDTLPMLGNVLLLCFFVFFIFGIVGVQLWKGLLRNRCFLELNRTNIPDHALFKYVRKEFENVEALVCVLFLVGTLSYGRSIYHPIKIHLCVLPLNLVA